MISPPTNPPEPNGSVTLADIPFSGDKTLQDVSAVNSPAETFVIPEQPQTSLQQPPVNKENQFIPGGIPVSNGMVETVPQAPPPQPIASNPWTKRILLMVIFFLLVAGGFIGIKFALPMLQSAKEVTISYWGLWEDEAVLQPLITEFQAKNPAIKVQYSKQSYKEYRQRLTAAIERGEGPDIFRFHNTWVPMLKDQLDPVPQTVMTASTFASTFYPVAANDLVSGQTIYGIPLMIDGLGLYYNERLFASAGITAPPTTWEELMEIVPKIAKSDTTNGFVIAAIALGTTANVEHYSDIIATMLMQNDANMNTLTGKEAEDTLIFYRKFSNPNDPVYTWNDTMDNSVYAFATEKVAMILAPSWRVFEIKQINPNIRFAIAPIPQLPGNTVTWASYWVEGVSAQSKYSKQAWEFVKFLTSRESAVKIYTEAQKIRLFGEPYARVDLGDTLLADPIVGAYISQAKSARSFPFASKTFDNGINDKLITYLENAINALGLGSSPARELDMLSAGFRQILTTYGLTSSAAPATKANP